MKRPVLFAICGIILIALALPDVALPKGPQKELMMNDPLFGITYLPSKAMFEPAPNEIFQCEDLLDPRSKFWLFGKVVKDGVTFYYVYGLLEVDFGAGPTGEFEAANDEGVIVVLSPSGCHDIGAGYALSPDPKQRRMAYDLGITDEVLSALLSDLVDREVKAFGGVSKFLAKVKAAGIPEANLDPQVRTELQALRKRADNEKKRKVKGHDR